MIWYRNLLLLIVTTIASANVFADEVYYLNDLSNCDIRLYQDKNLKRVDDKKFAHVVLNVKKVPSKPEFVAFKFDGQIYITRETCVMSATAKAQDIDNGLTGNEYKKKPRVLSEKEKFKTYKYFVEVESGLVNISNQGPVADYNNVFPNTSSTNPTVWSATSNSEYKTTRLLSLGFGLRDTDTRFLAFKLRLINGKKADGVDLTDTNTMISQSGVWNYEDSFKNFYGGYKFIFLDYSEWKPIVGAYLGLSHMTSQLTDGAETYQLSSLGIAALLEVGMEYHINSHFGFGGNFGFEYLGSRSLKFKDESVGTNFKTKMNYNNTYLSLGIKYYF